MERDFDGVFIPKAVWLDDRLSANEKIIFAEIHSLDGENHCYASNEYLANFCKVSIPTITRAIAHLKLLGYIEEISNNGRTRVLISKLKLIKLMKQTNQFDEADSSNCENLHYIENKKENNIEAPAKPDALLSKRHSQLHRDRKELNNILDSEQYIDNFEKGKKLSTKEKFKKNCLDEIDKLPYDDNTKQLLIEYFYWAIDGKDVRRIKNIDLWKSKLEKLEQIVKRTGINASDIVQQSIDKKWYTFEELNKATSSKNSKNDENVISQRFTRKEAMEEIEKRKQSGVKEY